MAFGFNNPDKEAWPRTRDQDGRGLSTPRVRSKTEHRGLPPSIRREAVFRWEFRQQFQLLHDRAIIRVYAESGTPAGRVVVLFGDYCPCTSPLPSSALPAPWEPSFSSCSSRGSFLFARSSSWLPSAPRARRSPSADAPTRSKNCGPRPSRAFSWPLPARRTTWRGTSFRPRSPAAAW